MFKCLYKLFLAASLGTFVLFGANLKDHYYRSQIGDNVVRVFNMEGTSGGTGFHIKTESGKVYILTNKHVCALADANNTVTIEKQGEKYVRQVFKRYTKHDLCLIDAISQDHDSIDLASSISHGEDIIVVGHPGLRQLTLAHGEYIGKEIVHLSSLVDKESECLNGKVHEDPIVTMMFGKLICVEAFVSAAISSPIYGGNSGSPAVNKFGNLVGVVFAGNRGQANDGYMVPLRFVKDFLKGL